MHKHTVHVHIEVREEKKKFGNRCGLFYIEWIYKRTSRRHIRRNRSFQYEGPQVPQVTYGKGREGNAFVSQCLPTVVSSPEHADISLQTLWLIRPSINKSWPLVNVACFHKYIYNMGFNLSYTPVIQNVHFLRKYWKFKCATLTEIVNLKVIKQKLCANLLPKNHQSVTIDNVLPKIQELPGMCRI